MRYRSVCLAAAMVCGTTAITACGSDNGGGASGAGGGAQTKKLAFAQRNSASDWWKAQNDGVKEAAENGKVDLVLGDGRGDPVTQNSLVKNYITQQVGAVILNPADPRGVASSVTALQQAKIPLVVVNSNLDQELTSEAYCYVAEDQKATGAKVGEEMAKVLAKKHGPDSTVKGIIVGGFPGEPVTQLRSDGFKEGYAKVADAPKLELKETIYGQWVADKALAPIREVATANPDLEVMFLASDSMLPAAQSALEGVGLWKKMTIGTYDGAMSTVKFMIENPDGPIVADGANVPDVQGATAVQIAQGAMAGKPQDAVCPGGTKYVDTPLYTPENAKQHYKAGKSF